VNLKTHKIQDWLKGIIFSEANKEEKKKIKRHLEPSIRIYRQNFGLDDLGSSLRPL